MPSVFIKTERLKSGSSVRLSEKELIARATGVKPRLFIESDKWPRFFAKNYNEETEINPYRAEMLARAVGAIDQIDEWDEMDVEWHQKRLSDSSSLDRHPNGAEYLGEYQQREARDVLKNYDSKIRSKENSR